jgi:gamma-glutamyltranspeptidase/glutathione hydrolase
MSFSVSASRISDIGWFCARTEPGIPAERMATAQVAATQRFNEECIAPMPFLPRPYPAGRQSRSPTNSRNLPGKLVRTLTGSRLVFRPPGAALRAALLAGLVLAVPGCSTVNKALGTGGGGATPPQGGVVADEPRAVVAGRDILAIGGSAADAAVATYFALSVTLPTVAGLGGGGVCINWSAGSGSAEVIDFLPRPTAGGAMTVPSNVRGMALLQARSGRLRWEQDIGPSETLARFGQPLSRAAAQALGDADPTKIGPDAYALFTRGSGKMAGEGTLLPQIQLAAVLARIRAAGAGDFYLGQVAHQLVANVGTAYGDLTLEDLRDSRPELAAPLSFELKDGRVFLPAPPASGGAVTADILAMLAYAKYLDAPPPQRAHILAEATRRAIAAEARRIGGEAGEIGTARRAAELMGDFQPTRANDGSAIALPAAVTPPASGLVAQDGDGNAVACSFTMLSTMGTGQMIADSGIVSAPPPPPSGVISMVPAVVSGGGSSPRLFLALATTGGAAAPSVAAATILAIRGLNQAPDAAIAQLRLYDGGGGVMLEPEAGDSAEALRAVGHTLLPPASIGRENLIACPAGGTERCSYLADPRGFGLAGRRG